MCKEVKWTVKFFFFLWIKLKRLLTFDRFRFNFIHGGKMDREVHLSLFKYALLFYSCLSLNFTYYENVEEGR